MKDSSGGETWKKIAVDAMGGDNAPQALVEGVNQAIRDFDDIEIDLVWRWNKN